MNCSEELRKISLQPRSRKLKENDHNCLVLRREVNLGPGETKTLRFMFGYGKASTPEKIIKGIKNQERLFNSTIEYWKGRLPQYHGPPDNYLSREVQWSYYCLEALTLIDGYYNTRFIPQGGNYAYAWGMHGATRDFAAYAQTMAFYNPELARSQLRLMMMGQDPDGRLFYEMTGYGKKNQWIYRPSDLDLWLIWAVTDYVLITRDFDFLDEKVPFYPVASGESATVYEHMRRSQEHLIDKVGIGKHGLIRLMLSDWNDEMTFLTARNNLFDTFSIFSQFRISFEYKSHHWTYCCFPVF